MAPRSDPLAPVVRTTSRAALATLAGLVLATTSACGAGSGAGAGDAPDLAGRSFEATEVTGYELADGGGIILTFQEDRLSAQGGCNTITGGATWEDGVLEAGPLASTMKACDEALMAQDTWLAAFLEGGPSVELSGSELTLSDGSASIVLSEAEG